MSDKKNIDHFFKDKLENFEVSPPEMAWKNIETKLKEKEEKKRVIPFWWKFAGAAAILLLGLGLYTAYNNGNTQTENPIVNQDKTTNPNQKNDVTNGANTSANPKEGTDSNLKNSNDPSANKGVATTPSKEKSNQTASSDKSSAANNSAVAISNNNKNTSGSNKRTADLKDVAANPNTSVAVSNAQSGSNKNNQKATNDTRRKVERNKAKPNAINETSSNSSIAVNKEPSNRIEQNTNKDSANPTIDKNTIVTNTDSKTDLAVNPKTPEEIKKIDSTKLAVVEPNALEELLNEKEKKITKEPKINRWQVTPNVAPIYFSSLSNGSPLDEKLTDNKKVYGTNFSYGLAVNYAVNKKYSIRTGIHSYSVDYDTKDIVFYQDTNASKMENLTPNTQGAYIQIDPLNNVTSSFGRVLGEKFEGSLNQKTSYIEVPFEVTYKVLSKKFGVDVIGGISTLYLNQNDVYLKGTNFTMKIGEASNLNTFHFSTNIGLGLKYSFLKRFDARIEPLFKYQINTYSSGAGNFKPYIFGVYSGISYHF